MRRRSDGMIIAGPRHYDGFMRKQIEANGGRDEWLGCEQGFIDQYGEFLNRQEAWNIAVERGQIFRNVSVDGTLYSENLY